MGKEKVESRVKKRREERHSFYQTRASRGKESKTEERGGEWGTVTHISCQTADYRVLNHGAEAQFALYSLFTLRGNAAGVEPEADTLQHRIKQKHNKTYT